MKAECLADQTHSRPSLTAAVTKARARVVVFNQRANVCKSLTKAGVKIYGQQVPQPWLCT